MNNATPLKWKLKLTVEFAPGESVEHDVTEWKRGGEIDLATLGLSMAEGKSIVAEIQTLMVAAQAEQHVANRQVGLLRAQPAQARHRVRLLRSP